MHSGCGFASFAFANLFISMFKLVIQPSHSDKRVKKGDPFPPNSKYFITGVGLKMEPLKCQQSAGSLKGQPLRRRCS